MQVFEHPSVSFKFPSSQSSVGDLIPSVQTEEQVLGLEIVPPEHEYPLTGPVQSVLHLIHPSSQASPKTTLESQQIGLQTEGLDIPHVQPDSILQVESHPSRFMRFPSSHCSPIVLTPFPQTSRQIEGEVIDPPEHV